MGESKSTTDHEKSRAWAEAPDDKPARVKGVGDDDAGQKSNFHNLDSRERS